MNISELKFQKYQDGLIPAIIQDYYSREVLMLGFMNEEALKITMESEYVTFYSRSRKQLWTKGETSGNTLRYISSEADCDSDTLLIQAIPSGPVCHTGNDTCFSAKNNESTDLKFLDNLIANRIENPKEGSYTNLLLSNINKAAQKVGEEAVETVIEAKDNHPELFLNESADLLYHLLVLIRAKGHRFSEVTSVLQERHKTD